MAENMFMTPHAPAQLGLNISDIIDVISGDKEYRESEMLNFAKGGAASDSVSSSVSQNDPDIELKRKAHVEIVEQPQQKALRFRYICEGRSAGSIPGVRSTAENKTYPTIKIVGYKGAAVVVVSCVTVDPPYRPHPHNLVGKEGCNKGVCTITIDNDSMECMFSNLGIQCVKKRDVKQALNLREEIRVDPFATGFAHVDQPIDLNAVRLCFQVFLRNGKNGRFTFPLKAAISDPIYDKKATCDLTITKLSDCSSCVSGGKEIILLCDKVTKEDIQIRFYEVKDDRVVWEAYGDFLASDVHKQFAIAFKTPKYKNLEVQNSVNCFIQLQRPSDKSTSEPRPFEYIPMNADPLGTKRKRGEEFDPFWVDMISLKPATGGLVTGADSQDPLLLRPMRIASRNSYKVKTEPIDHQFSPSPEPRVGMTVKAPISPQHKTSGGGVLYQSSPQMQPLFRQFHNVPTSPNGQLINLAIAPPQAAQFYPVQHSPLESSFPPNLPVESSYPQENALGVTAPVFAVPHYLHANDAIMEFDNRISAQYHTLEAPKMHPGYGGSIGLPDLGFINSSELSAAADLNMNTLSANMSSSLNIGDHLPNILDKKCNNSLVEKMNNATGEICTPNISLNDPMTSVDALPAQSDSIKNLTLNLQHFNKLADS